MTSTALAPPHSNSDTVILYRDRTAGQASLGISRDTHGILLGLQSDTGRLQTVRSSVLPTPVTSWFEELWTKALEAKAESAWHLLPEEVFDRLDEDDEGLLPLDVQFLGFAAVSNDMPTVAAVAAIRLLGILAEEHKLDMADVLPVLLEVLSHDAPQRRYHGAKAIWQSKAREALPALRRRLEREDSERVRSVIKRTIAVLES
jgi:hypothetical protein